VCCCCLLVPFDVVDDLEFPLETFLRGSGFCKSNLGIGTSVGSLVNPAATSVDTIISFDVRLVASVVLVFSD